MTGIMKAQIDLDPSISWSCPPNPRKSSSGHAGKWWFTEF